MTSPANILTASSVATWQSCPREWQLRYLLGYAPVTSAHALRFGSLVHLGLEEWWRAWVLGEDNSRLVAALAPIHADETCDPWDRAAARALLTGYHERWKSQPYETLGVEVEFRRPLATGLQTKTGKTRVARGYNVAGKFDGVARSRIDGRMWLVEHKTTSETIEPCSPYWRKLKVDRQVSLYLSALRRDGYDVVGCLYDVIRKPTLRPKMATPESARKYKQDGTLYASQRDEDETPEAYEERLLADIAERPDDYFARAPVVRTAEEIAEHERDLYRVSRQIARAVRELAFPMSPGSCRRFNSFCRFFPVCAGEASILDEQLYQHKPPHSELTEVIGAEQDEEVAA